MASWRTQQRKKQLAMRAAMPETQFKAVESACLRHLTAYLAKFEPSLLGIYWPIRRELDIQLIVGDLIEQGWELALPDMNQQGSLDFVRWQPGIPMQTGKWGIATPMEKTACKPSVYVVPLVGYDEQRYRMGYGGGYYDRTLAGFSQPPTTIGLGLSQSYYETIHPQAHDIAMDCIITEHGPF